MMRLHACVCNLYIAAVIIISVIIIVVIMIVIVVVVVCSKFVFFEIALCMYFL